MRVSGPAAGRVAVDLAGRLPEPRVATLARLREPASGETIDQGLLLYFPGPASFTGEDVLELQHHGSIAVARMLSEVLGAMPGLRPAEPGEFSRRAFLNGKLDLTQVEGLADLIEATTAAQARAAVRQMDGLQGRQLAEWREILLQALSLLEAEIDFAAEEEVPEAAWSSLAPTLHRTAETIRERLDDRGRGERLRHGLTIAVVGAPNVGKSSLVNAIAKRDVAIVTAFPGTTRDVIEVALDLEGLPVTLLDTAGLRESDDPVEQAGMARARERAAEADLRLHVVDCPGDVGPVATQESGSLTVLNKLDLWPQAAVGSPAVAVSVRTGEGLDRLLGAVADAARELLPGEDATLVTRARHRAALTDAVMALDRALAIGDAADLGLLAEELRLAAQAIGRVTGAFGAEDILDRIFATFCIGK